MRQTVGSAPGGLHDIEFRGGGPADVEAILGQFDDRSARWARWQYLENPSCSETPFEVAVRDDRIIGVAGFVPMRLTTRSGELEAVRLGDVVLSPQCRRPGVRSALVRRGIARYAERGFALGFVERSTQNATPSSPWHEVAPIESWYRFHRTRFGQSHVLGRMLDGACRASTTALTAAMRSVADIRRACTATPIQIESQQGVPAETFAGLVGRHRGLHAAPTAAFFRWRYANPEASYRTHMGYRHGSPIAAIVAERIRRQGMTATYLTPFMLSEQRTSFIARLLTAVAVDQRDADLLIFPGGTVPTGVLERLGFISDRRFPLSLVAARRSLEVARFDPREYRPILDTQVTDPRAWRLTYAEMGPITTSVARNGSAQPRAPMRRLQQSA